MSTKKFPSHLKKKLSLLTISIIICLFFLELALRYISPPQLFNVGSSQTENARLYGWAPTPNERVQFVNPDTGQTEFFHINSKGWKDVEHSYNKPEGIFRILFLGDSNTFGLIPLEQLYTRLTEKILHANGYNNTEVISIGVGGWGTDQILEALSCEGVKYNADLIIYQFCGNDIAENMSPIEANLNYNIFRAKPFTYRIKDNKPVKLKVVPKEWSSPFFLSVKRFMLRSALIWNLNKLKNISLPATAHNTPVQTSRDINIITNENGEIICLQYEKTKTNHWWDARPQTYSETSFTDLFPGTDPGYLQYAWHLQELLILEMKSLSEHAGATFIIFSEESDQGKRAWSLRWNRFQSDGQTDYIFENGIKHVIDWTRPLQKMRVICDQHNIPLIEPVRTYERYEYDPHANAAGNMAMAQDIVDFLITNNFLPPRLPGKYNF